MSLDRRARQVFAELEISSNGRIYSYQPIGSKGGFSSSEPRTGDPDPPFIVYRRAYEVCVDDSGRLAVIEAAEAALKALRVRTVPEGFKVREEAPIERIERLLHRGEGIPLQEAAFRLNCAPSELLRLRKNAGRDGHLGRLIEAVPKGQRRQRALELLGQNVSVRDVARSVGAHPTQVQRWKESP